MQYTHTQTAPLYLVVAATGVGMFARAYFVPEQAVQSILVSSGVLMLALAFSFQKLTVRDECDALLIAFGPLPLFRRHLRYSLIERVEQAKSTILDGWGIHLSPSGGWTWNLWGFDCIDVWYTKGSKTKKVRIGTDDPTGLSAFLKRRIGEQQATGIRSD